MMTAETKRIMDELNATYAVQTSKEDQLKAWALEVGYKAVMDSNCPSWLKGWMSRQVMGGDHDCNVD